VMGLQGLGGAMDGQTVARYDYDAFGNRITNTAPELGEEVNPFGFSTKFTDEETGLVYYGYRYYSPEVGRWVNRDPIEEEGGLNLYGMVGNDAVNRVDVLGLVYDVFITREKGFPGHDVLTGSDPFGKDFGRDYTSSSGGWAIFKTEPGKWNKAFPPRNPRDVFIFDTELVLRNSKFEAGKMKGCPCSLAATKENVYSCLDAVTPIGTSGVFHGIAICGHNCRTATIEAIEKCCLKKGQLLNPPVFDWDPNQPWKTKRPWERPDGSKDWNPPTPWKL
jgi:RHS repeat-associated protein